MAGYDTPTACVIRDMSVTGARLELRNPPQSGSGAPAIGSEMTLTFETAWERTSSQCQIVWFAGHRCGVRFQGQFRTTAKPCTAAAHTRKVSQARGKRIKRASDEVSWF